MVAGSKLNDAQAAYESNMTMSAVLLSGANFVFHSAGWNEAGLSASFSKFMLDAEQVAMFCKSVSPVNLEDLDQCVETIKEVGTRRPFLGYGSYVAEFLKRHSSCQNYWTTIATSNGCPKGQRMPTHAV